MFTFLSCPFPIAKWAFHTSFQVSSINRVLRNIVASKEQNMAPTPAPCTQQDAVYDKLRALNSPGGWPRPDSWYRPAGDTGGGAGGGGGGGGGQYPLAAPAESPPVGQQPPTVTSHLRDDLKSEIGECSAVRAPADRRPMRLPALAGGTVGANDVTDGTVGGNDVTDGTAGGDDVTGGTVGANDVTGGTAGGNDVTDGTAGGDDVTGGTAGGNDVTDGTGEDDVTGGTAGGMTSTNCATDVGDNVEGPKIEVMVHCAITGAS